MLDPPDSRLPVLWRHRALLVLALCLHGLLLTSRPVGFWESFTFDAVATQGRRGWDFYAVYQAGHNVLTGASIYESDNDKIDVVVPLYTPYRYLPFLATTWGVVLNILSPATSLGLWVFVIEGLYLLCIALAWRHSGSGARGAVLAAMWLAFTPYYLELYLGQFNVAQAVLILVFLLQETQQPGTWRGELAWGASLLVKPHSGLLAFPLLRGRRWRALLIGVVGVVVMSAPYMALHPTALGAFLHNFVSDAPAPQLGNLGVRQLIYSGLSALCPSMSASAHNTVQSLWVALVMAIALGLTFQSRRADPSDLYCFWLTSYLVLYHHVWEHHYILLLPVFTVLYLKRGAWPVLLFYLPIALWTPYRWIDPGGRAAYDASMRWTLLEPIWLDVLYHASKAIPTLLLWVYLIGQLRLGVHATPASPGQPGRGA